MKRIVFMGTPDFAVPILQQLLKDNYEVILVVTQPDRPKGRKKQLTPPPVKEEATKHGIPVYQPEKIKNEYTAILEKNPDLIITAAFGQILPNELLEAPPFGCINVHASLLPELRGGAPIHHAIIQGKKKTGITIMYMAEKLDAGDILTQKSVEITKDDNVGTLHDKLSLAGSELLHTTLPKLFAGELVPKKQDDNQVTFGPNIKRGQEKIEWSLSQENVYNLIRGLNPWPVAYTIYQGSVLKIWKAETSISAVEGKPGEIVDLKADGIIVACGDGKALKITELQPAGKKRMMAEDFLRGSGSSIAVGQRLGDE